MATLAIGLIVYEITVQWQSVTKGYMGISGIPPLGIGSFEAASDREQLVLLSVLVALCMASAWLIRHSRFGRALVALSGSEEAARALGIDVARYKLAAFVVSAVYAAIAGSLFVHIVGFVSPEVFGLSMVVLGFTMLYVGGIRTITGPLVGAVVINLLPETVRGLKEYQDLVYGAALILLHLTIHTAINDVSDAGHEHKRNIFMHEHTLLGRDLQAFTAKVWCMSA